MSVTGWLRSCLAVVLTLALASTAWAQAGTASLIGEVVDQQKQVVPGASVTLTHRQTGVAQTTISDERGQFRFVNMRPGRYDLEFEVSGRLADGSGTRLSSGRVTLAYEVQR